MKVPPRFCSQRCNGIARLGTGLGPAPNRRYDCLMCGKPCSVYRSPSAPEPRFCSVKCIGQAQQGPSNPSYTGGRVIQSAGYIWILAPDHPRADVRGYVYEHRLVVEQQIGRYLTDVEVVHHRNRTRSDNRAKNLLLLPSQAAHLELHRREDSDA